MRIHLVALAAVAVFGLGATTCDNEGLVFHLSDATLAPGTMGDMQLVYSEGDLFVDAGGVCGFEVHWTYDPAALSFPTCEGPGASHLCGTPAIDGHPGLFCFCNASSPGLIEVAAITANGVTPLPRGPLAVGVFPVAVAADARPELYEVDFEVGDPTIGYVTCDLAAMEAEQLEFRSADVVVLE